LSDQQKVFDEEEPTDDMFFSKPGVTPRDVAVTERDIQIEFEQELGMTASRQAKVRRSLFSMLGDSDAKRRSVAAGSGATRGGSSNQSVAAAAAGNKNGKAVAGKSSSIARKSSPGVIAPAAVMHVVESLWICETCKVKNSERCFVCSACGSSDHTE
jgi:hypothetical protein